MPEHILTEQDDKDEDYFANLANQVRPEATRLRVLQGGPTIPLVELKVTLPPAVVRPPLKESKPSHD